MSKKLIFKSTKVLVTLFLFNLNIVFAENCTKDQAFDRMMALNRAADRMLKEVGPSHDARRRQLVLNQEIGAVGKYLGEGKYGEACKYYTAIAEKWGIDIKAESKGMLTMKDIKKDGGKSRGGKCSQADASIKMNALLQKLQAMKAAGTEVDAISSAYYKMLEDKSDLMSTNPSAFCDEIDAFKGKYSLLD